MTYADTFLVLRMETREWEALCLCEAMGLFRSRGELLFSAAGFRSQQNRLAIQNSDEFGAQNASGLLTGLPHRECHTGCAGSCRKDRKTILVIFLSYGGFLFLFFLGL